MAPADPGTCITVAVRHHIPNRALFAMGIGFGTFMGVVAGGVVALLLPLLALVGLGLGDLGMWIANRALSRTNSPEADYLMHRIEEAVAVAGDSGPLATAG